MSDSNPVESAQSTQFMRLESIQDLAQELPDYSVRIIEGTRPKFSSETASLLRSRLQIAAFVFSVIATLAFISNILSGNTLLAGVRAGILLALIGGCVLLRSKVQLNLFQLHCLEVGFVAILALQLLFMTGLQIVDFANAQDATSAVSAKRLCLAAFAFLILTYGSLMPNTWQRALCVLLPVACLPHALLSWLPWQHPPVAAALAMDNMVIYLSLPLLAVLVACMGSYYINDIRHAAFEAQQLGQYLLKRKLGEGGMGEVYEAEHLLLKRPCAIKLIHPSKSHDAKVLERFEREVQATAKLSHWHTVEVFDYGHTTDGTFYYVMELLPGLSLDELVKRHGPLLPQRAVHFLSEACQALQEAHAKGLIHRDIKPANLFSAERGGMLDVTKLLDFGLVRVELSPQQVTPEGERAFSGSPSYMCPEQAKSYDSLDCRSDIYSLGAVAYFLVTGQPPFVRDSIRDYVRAHAREPVVAPSQLNAKVPQDLELVILRCLEKQPGARYQSAASLERALDACQCKGQWTQADARAWWLSHSQGHN